MIDKNNNIKCLLIQIRQMQYIINNKIALLTKAIICKKKSDINVRKI